ncbi:MAG: beta-N-acetylhexosaminidase [Deltaproteobacteria bacterium]|nr:beta-N-acetylhexosaminidase [Deltaproteobacteria bacterium]
MTKILLPRSEVRRAIGNMIICGFDGTSITAELRELLREVQPLGIIQFSRNIESLEQICEFNRELKHFRKDEPLLCSVDQEGGRVARIREPATIWPSMRQLGKLNDPKLVASVAKAIAQELRALNFDINYAPVLDVDSNPQNPIIGDRSFSNNPQLVGKLASAFIAGLQNGGIGGCGKHFPGHGDTDKDSHLELPFVDHNLTRLRELEWPPFHEAIKVGVGAIMTAHLIVVSLDEKHPATISTQVLKYLRNELNFNGVILSDDIEMKALADHFSIDEIATLGVNAGINVFLACHEPAIVLELYRALVLAVENKKISHETLLYTGKRLQTWKQRFYQPATSWVQTKHLIGPTAHGALIDKIQQLSLLV